MKADDGDQGTVGESLVATMRSADIQDEIGGLATMGAESLLEGDLAAGVPVLKTIAGFYRSGKAVSNIVLTRKIIGFLGAFGEATAAQREQMVQRLADDEGYGKRVGEQLMLLLERLNDARKAEFVGKCFGAYCRDQIDLTVLKRLVYAIDALMYSDIVALKNVETVQRTVVGGNAGMQRYASGGLAFVPGNRVTTAWEFDVGVVEALKTCIFP